MKIAIGSDRRGFITKRKLIEYLERKCYEVIDFGPFDQTIPVDYPIYGEKVGNSVASGESDFGIVICATGIGIMIAANKINGVQCGIAYTDEIAHLMREHNNANIIAFGQDYMDYSDIERRVDIFLNAQFNGSYHKFRIAQLRCLEEGKEIHQTPLMNPHWREI